MNGYATSGSTPTKDAHFREILDVHIRCTKAILAKCEKKYPKWANPAYHYFDLNAGPGIDTASRHGSPMVFLDLIEHYQMNYRAVLFERDKKNSADLIANVGEKAEVVTGDHIETFPSYFNKAQKNTFGLVYSDPSGNVPPFELLADWSSYPSYARTDVLIYVSSANVKRALKSPKAQLESRLDELIHLINKRFWIVREPQNKHQWTFLIGTNWIDFPAFERIGFHKTTSEKGKEIMYRLNTTNEERKLWQNGLKDAKSVTPVCATDLMNS
jgi:three-Cys-motif partner protein